MDKQFLRIAIEQPGSPFAFAAELCAAVYYRGRTSAFILLDSGTSKVKFTSPQKGLLVRQNIKNNTNLSCSNFFLN